MATMTRDMEIAQRIDGCRASVLAQRETMAGVVEHALRNNASSHAALYEDVLSELNEALTHLERAHLVMAEGEIEDYE